MIKEIKKNNVSVCMHKSLRYSEYIILQEN